MQTLFDYLNANPWIYGIMALSLAVWIAALSVILTSPKFLRKWLWALLTLVSFTFTWAIDTHFTLGVGIPVGALYVLWFWRFGKSPTDEEIAERGPKPAGEGRRGMAWQIVCLRLAYLIAIAGAAALGVWAVTGNVFEPIFSLAGATIADIPPDFRAMLEVVKYFQAGFMFLICGVFVLLFLRPYGWGKVLTLFSALSWLGFCSAFTLLSGGFDMRIAPVLAAGVGMVLAAALHHIADPRFTGTYLRQS